MQSPELVLPIIDELKTLREGHQEDFTLLKYLVTTMLGYRAPIELSFYNRPLLQERIKAARDFELELRKKHGYSKYQVHLDFLEISELKEVTSAKDFDTICRPYLMERAGGKHWQYGFKV